MSMVCRPSKVIGQFEGYDLILRSNHATADYEKFTLVCDKLYKYLMETSNANFKHD